MKKAFRVSLVGLWVLLATGFLTSWWLAHPDKFPHIPESWALWLVNLLYDTQNEVVDVVCSPESANEGRRNGRAFGAPRG